MATKRTLILEDELKEIAGLVQQNIEVTQCKSIWGIKFWQEIEGKGELSKHRSWQTLKNKMKTVSKKPEWATLVPNVPRFSDSQEVKKAVANPIGEAKLEPKHYSFILRKLYEKRQQLMIDDTAFWTCIVKDSDLQGMKGEKLRKLFYNRLSKLTFSEFGLSKEEEEELRSCLAEITNISVNSSESEQSGDDEEDEMPEKSSAEVVPDNNVKVPDPTKKAIKASYVELKDCEELQLAFNSSEVASQVEENVDVGSGEKRPLTPTSTLVATKKPRLDAVIPNKPAIPANSAETPDAMNNMLSSRPVVFVKVTKPQSGKDVKTEPNLLPDFYSNIKEVVNVCPSSNAINQKPTSEAIFHSLNKVYIEMKETNQELGTDATFRLLEYTKRVILGLKIGLDSVVRSAIGIEVEKFDDDEIVNALMAMARYKNCTNQIISSVADGALKGIVIARDQMRLWKAIKARVG